MILDEIADVRTGDKGDDLIIAVLPREEASFDLVTASVTVEKVAVHYGLDGSVASVRRVLMPTISAMVFHLVGVLGGGVTGSSYLDGHGKTVGYHLFTLEIEGPNTD